MESLGAEHMAWQHFPLVPHPEQEGCSELWPGHQPLLCLSPWRSSAHEQLGKRGLKLSDDPSRTKRKGGGPSVWVLTSWSVTWHFQPLPVEGRDREALTGPATPAQPSRALPRASDTPRVEAETALQVDPGWLLSCPPSQRPLCHCDQGLQEP